MIENSGKNDQKVLQFYIKTFGCQMNVNDSEKMAAILTQKGLIPCQHEDEADFVIVNSCAVREKAQNKIYSYIGRLARAKKIIVAGCVAQVEKENLLKGNSSVHFVVGTHQFYQIGKIIDRIIGDNHQRLEVGLSRQWQELIPPYESRHSSVTAYISIMEGCNNFCSYCIVPFTRGREKYRPGRQILAEAEFLASKNYQEIILLGQNVNSWQDKSLSLNFPGLLDRLAGQIKVKWIRFITSYPGYYDHELIDVMGKWRQIARHIHFPGQSGSTRILKKMNRSYTRSQYLKIIQDFKKHIPEIKFSADFIVGFPQETDHDFELTLSLMRQVEFESVFSFVYSPRLHTRALELGDNVPVSVKKERLHKLQELQEEIQLKNNKALIGTRIEVLVTGPNPKKGDEVIGRSETYRVVNFRSQAQAGQWRQVLIKNAGPHSLRGEEIG